MQNPTTHIQVVGEWFWGASAACPQAVGGGVLALQSPQHFGVALHGGHGGVQGDPSQGDPVRRRGRGRRDTDTVDSY